MSIIPPAGVGTRPYGESELSSGSYLCPDPRSRWTSPWNACHSAFLPHWTAPGNSDPWTDPSSLSCLGQGVCYSSKKGDECSHQKLMQGKRWGVLGAVIYSIWAEGSTFPTPMLDQLDIHKYVLSHRYMERYCTGNKYLDYTWQIPRYTVTKSQRISVSLKSCECVLDISGMPCQALLAGLHLGFCMEHMHLTPWRGLTKHGEQMTHSLPRMLSRISKSL